MSSKETLKLKLIRGQKNKESNSTVHVQSGAVRHCNIDITVGEASYSVEGEAALDVV